MNIVTIHVDFKQNPNISIESLLDKLCQPHFYYMRIFAYKSCHYKNVYVQYIIFFLYIKCLIYEMPLILVFSSLLTILSLNNGISSEKCAIRQFHHFVNIIKCIYTNIDIIAYYTPRLYGIVYCSEAINLNRMFLH